MHEGSVHSRAVSDRSVEVLFADEASGGEEDILDSANKADISQGSMSLPDISAADDEDTSQMQGMCELAHKSNIDFAVWKDKLIRDGMTGIYKSGTALSMTILMLERGGLRTLTP